MLESNGCGCSVAHLCKAGYWTTDRCRQSSRRKGEAEVVVVVVVVGCDEGVDTRRLRWVRLSVVLRR